MANIAPDGSLLRLLEETNQHEYLSPPDSGAYGDRNAKGNEGIELSGLEPSNVSGDRDYTPIHDISNDTKLAKDVEVNTEPLAGPKRDWKNPVRWCAYANVLVLLVNIAFTVASVEISSRQGLFSFESVVLSHGSCSKIKQVKIGLHLLINVLGLTLSATSSYCSNIITAPSRKDVDEAHCRRLWLSIGSFSGRNLLKLNIRRKTQWALLIITSIAMQLTYNSVIYSTISSNAYAAVMVPPEFVSNNTIATDSFKPGTCFEQQTGWTMPALRNSILEGKFEVLSAQDCIKTYAVNWLSDRDTVVAVTAEQMANNSIYLSGYSDPLSTRTKLSYGRRNDVYNWDWMCFGISGVYSGECDKTMLEGVDTSWELRGIISTVNGTDFQPSCYDLHTHQQPHYPFIDGVTRRIDYCLSHKTGGSCELLYNLPIAIVVLVCNLVKMICIFTLLLEDRRDLLLTVGDAISSFLQNPDPTTSNDCMLARPTARLRPGQLHSWNPFTTSDLKLEVPALPPPPIPRQPRRRPSKWKKALSSFSWALTWITFGSYLGATLAFSYGPGLAQTGTFQSVSSIWDIKGFGTVQASSLLTNLPSSLIQLQLLVNTPQLLVSLFSNCLNDHLTRMLFAAEYNSFALRRKPLRVSFPKGEQRSTLYLTIPYRYSVPLLITFVLVHWLVSEGISFVQIIPYDLFGIPIPSEQVITCSVSVIPLQIGLYLAAVALLVFLCLTQRKFKCNTMPHALNCSAAISAACHAPLEDYNAAFRPIMWGVVEGMVVCEEGGSGEVYSHCSFTSQDVTIPEVDVPYA